MGQCAHDIAKLSKFDVNKDTKIIVAEIDGVGDEFPLSKEKLSPVLAWIKVKDAKEGIEKCIEMTEYGGIGHTAVIHSKNEEVILEFSKKVKTGRLLVNTPSSQGAIGGIYTTNTPSLTLGCGSMGNNSTTDNISSINLINKKKVTKRISPMQWFKVPEKIYHEKNSIQYLQKLPGANRIMIVTDRNMMELG